MWYGMTREYVYALFSVFRLGVCIFQRRYHRRWNLLTRVWCCMLWWTRARERTATYLRNKQFCIYLLISVFSIFRFCCSELDFSTRFLIVLHTTHTREYVWHIWVGRARECVCAYVQWFAFNFVSVRPKRTFIFLALFILLTKSGYRLFPHFKIIKRLQQQ